MEKGMDERIIYLDNAATSFPKPRGMLDRMLENRKPRCHGVYKDGCCGYDGEF